MNWETYRKMTPEQREEWKFKFGNGLYLYPTIGKYFLIFSIFKFLSLTGGNVHFVVERKGTGIKTKYRLVK